MSGTNAPTISPDPSADRDDAGAGRSGGPGGDAHSGDQQVMASSDSGVNQRVRDIAEATAEAWWRAKIGGSDEIPLGVVAALSLMTRSGPTDPHLAQLVLDADRDQLADLLRHIWRLFAIVRPELVIRVGPFARWLDSDPTVRLLEGARVTARAAVEAGLFDVTVDREVVCHVDVLGHCYQALRTAGAKKTNGEIYTPRDVAMLNSRFCLDSPAPGDAVYDSCAGTGAYLRTAAQVLRARGVDPHAVWWYASDIDPTAVAALAVNVHLWNLGLRTVIGCADIFTEPDWEKRARAEQRQAIKDHKQRVLIARLLTSTTR